MVTTNYYGLWMDSHGDIQVVSDDLLRTSWLKTGSVYWEEALGLKENIIHDGMLLPAEGKRYLIPLSFWL